MLKKQNINYKHILNNLENTLRHLFFYAIICIAVLCTYWTFCGIFRVFNISTFEITCQDYFFENDCEKKLLEKITHFILFAIWLFFLVKSCLKPITWKTVFMHISFFFLVIIISIIIDTEIMYTLRNCQGFIHSDQY